MTKVSPGRTSNPFTLVSGLTGRCCAAVRDFVVIGGIDGSPYSVRWSAIGDPTDWPTPDTDDARAKQAGQQDFPPQYGYVTAIGGNDFFMYVFQERAITKGTYVGGDVVFSFDTFEEDRGCVRSGMIERIDDKYFFRSDRGYHLLEGDQIADIGYGVVDDSYRDGLSVSLKSTSPSVVSNKARHHVYFEKDNVCYNYKTNQWTAIPAYDGFALFSVNNVTATIGLVRYDANSAVDLQTQTATGAPQTITMETASQDINEGGRAFIRGVRPLSTGGTPEVQIGTQDGLGDTVTYTSKVDVNSRNGMCDVRAEGRYMRVKVTYTNGPTTIYGADVDFAPAGFV